MKRLGLFFLLLVFFASSCIHASFAPTDQRCALIEDINGDRISVETVSDEIWYELTQLYYNGSEMWIGGAVETYENEWGFRFDPNMIMIAEITVEMIQSTLSLISGDLDYWLHLGVAVVWAKVVEITEWVPYVPFSDEVELTFWLQNGVAYINASLILDHTGYEVSHWGIVNNLTNNLYVNSLIWGLTVSTLPTIKVEHTYVLGSLEHGPYSFTFKAWGVPVNSISFSIPRPPDVTTVDICPNPLSVVSDKPWVTTYTELPVGCDVVNINVSTLKLNGTVPAELSSAFIGDYDNDADSDLMVKFSRSAVSDLIISQGINHGSVVLTITGQLNNGTQFEGSDIVKVRMPGDINSDGIVNIDDLILTAKSYGTYEGHPDWYPIVDENEDGQIGIFDLFIIARNYGKTYP